jgi:hypothetical protein
LRLRFGGAKGSTVVDIFMICPDDWLVIAESGSVLDLGYLMACNRVRGRRALACEVVLDLQ